MRKLSIFIIATLLIACEYNDTGLIITDTKNSGDYFVRAFIFQYDGDESELKDLLQIDGKNYKGDLSINIQTYKGERINN